jgi:hypothetical protein
MVHMTLDIPKDLYQRMRQHPEVKWSEVARRSFAEYLSELSGDIAYDELRRLLKDETLDAIRSLDGDRIKQMSDEMVRLEWQRMGCSTRTS